MRALFRPWAARLRFVSLSTPAVSRVKTSLPGSHNASVRLRLPENLKSPSSPAGRPGRRTARYSSIRLIRFSTYRRHRRGSSRWMPRDVTNGGTCCWCSAAKPRRGGSVKKTAPASAGAVCSQACQLCRECRQLLSRALTMAPWRSSREPATIATMPMAASVLQLPSSNTVNAA